MAGGLSDDSKILKSVDHQGKKGVSDSKTQLLKNSG